MSWIDKFRQDFNHANVQWEQERDFIGDDTNFKRAEGHYIPEMEAWDRDYIDQKNRLLSEYDPIFNQLPKQATSVKDLRTFSNLKEKAEQFSERWKNIKRATFKDVLKHRKMFEQLAEPPSIEESNVANAVETGTLTDADRQRILSQQSDEQAMVNMMRAIRNANVQGEVTGEDLAPYLSEEENTPENFIKAMEMMKSF